MTAPDDEALGTAVARMYAAADPPPAGLLRAASALLPWRNPDAALASLLLDSAVAGAAAGVRGAPGTIRTLSYTCDDVVIDVELTVTDDEVRLVGQVSLPAAAPLEIRHRDGVWTGVTDTVGRFSTGALPLGPLRVSWGPHRQGARPISTPTILP